MKKICMVGLGIGKTHGAFIGGHVNGAINLSKILARNEFEVHIVTTPPIHSDNLEERTYELQNGVLIHQLDIDYANSSKKISEKGRLSIWAGAKAYPKLVSAIRQLHKTENFDVIHGHSGFPWVGLIPEYVKIREKVPAIHTLYCPIDRTLFNILASKFSLSKLDLVIGISKNVEKSLVGVLPKKKIKMIPPLIDLSRFKYSPRKKRDSKNILFVGNMSKAKGLHILLDALKIVRKNHPNVNLLLGLDIPLDEFKKGNSEIKRKIEQLGLSDNVIPLGIIKDLPTVMRNSAILVAPFTSTQGPADYPLVILEAMASGLPVVASNVGGIPEIVKHGENGLLVKPNNPIDLANAIIYLLDDPNTIEKMGQQGAEFIQSLTTSIVDSYVKIYQNLRGLYR